jgi:hypothetical protein
MYPSNGSVLPNFNPNDAYFARIIFEERQKQIIQNQKFLQHQDLRKNNI